MKGKTDKKKGQSSKITTHKAVLYYEINQQSQPQTNKKIKQNIQTSNNSKLTNVNNLNKPQKYEPKKQNNPQKNSATTPSQNFLNQFISHQNTFNQNKIGYKNKITEITKPPIKSVKISDTSHDNLFFVEENVEKELNSFKPFYGITVNSNTITINIIFNQDKEEISEASIKFQSNYYLICIQGEKKKLFKELENNEECTIEYGHFIIEEKLPSNIFKEKILNWTSNIKSDDNGTIFITFSPKKTK